MLFRYEIEMSCGNSLTAGRGAALPVARPCPRHRLRPPPGVAPAALTWAETVAPRNYTHKVLARGTRVRLTDVTGEACAHVLLYNADQPWERLNVADTVKISWQAYLTAGHPLLSGDGRVLAAVAEDEADGHHDALCGTTSSAACRPAQELTAPRQPANPAALLQVGVAGLIPA
jgi:uncharacterized protein YcgI (DUF1989 family)